MCRAFLAANYLLAAGDQSLGMRLLPKYGYFAILFAAFWEGEAVLIAAGVLCGSGYLDWRLTIVAAAIGGGAGGQIYFFSAPHRPGPLLNKTKKKRKRGSKNNKIHFFYRGGGVMLFSLF